jgi:tetratricopeptide (TPR) repeat protein
VGLWHDAVLANEVVVRADDAYLELCGKRVNGVYPLGYVPHNHHFLWFAASMAGNSAAARRSALATAKRVDQPELMRKPGFEGLQAHWMTPWFDRVRFGRWDEIAALPNPAPDLPYATAIWHYAQAMAALRQSRTPAAVEHHEALARIATDPALERLLVWDRYPLSRAVRVAEQTVRELDLARGQPDAAVAALREAVGIEDAIPYDEPPGWHAPVRHTLGAALLQAGHAAEAEQVYREELRRNPQNGWSLNGLAASLRAQGRSREADEVAVLQARAWEHADVKLAGSRF